MQTLVTFSPPDVSCSHSTTFSRVETLGGNILGCGRRHRINAHSVHNNVIRLRRFNTTTKKALIHNFLGINFGTTEQVWSHYFGFASVKTNWLKVVPHHDVIWSWTFNLIWDHTLSVVPQFLVYLWISDASTAFESDQDFHLVLRAESGRENLRPLIELTRFFFSFLDVIITSPLPPISPELASDCSIPVFLNLLWSFCVCPKNWAAIACLARISCSGDLKGKAFMGIKGLKKKQVY